VRGFVLFHRTPPTPGNKGGTTMQCVVARIAPLGQDPVLTESGAGAQCSAARAAHAIPTIDLKSFAAEVEIEVCASRR